jgi:UDP-glucose 4-epimerase
LYGTRAGPQNSIQRILTQALQNGKIEYEGTGDEIREFIHVLDAAKISADILNNDEYSNSNVLLSGSEKLRYSDLLTMVKEILNNKVEIVMTPSTRDAHYKVTPYNFSPKIGKKYVSNSRIDMGQGLLHCLADIYENQICAEKKAV